ncbi:MAG: hypothetical protein ACP5T0_05120 [Verrucomicrobiia bacterium]
MSAEKIIIAFTLVPLAMVFAYFFYSEKKRRQFLQPETKEKVFRCVQCGLVYTDDNEVELSPCPKCGASNEEFKF